MSAVQLIEHLQAVSTHAPARGATEDFDELMVERDVSTHAPARGATHIELD